MEKRRRGILSLYDSYHRQSRMIDEKEIVELEWKLQTATADYLTGCVYKGLRIVGRTEIPFPTLKFHHPALEYRGDAEGKKYKRRGTTPGIWDWLLWGPNRWHGQIELKVAGRGLNENQKRTERWLTEYGFPHEVCRTVKEFRDTIIGFGFECKNMSCREPDYLTKEQKQQICIDMFKPE